MRDELQLRIWWIPQVPMKPFHMPVSDIEQAKLVFRTLAAYDEFQCKNKIKPDYCNLGGLQVFENAEWVDWFDPETGESINELVFAEADNA